MKEKEEKRPLYFTTWWVIRTLASNSPAAAAEMQFLWMKSGESQELDG